MASCGNNRRWLDHVCALVFLLSSSFAFAGVSTAYKFYRSGGLNCGGEGSSWSGVDKSNVLSSAVATRAVDALMPTNNNYRSHVVTSAGGNSASGTWKYWDSGWAKEVQANFSCGFNLTGQLNCSAGQHVNFLTGQCVPDCVAPDVEDEFGQCKPPEKCSVDKERDSSGQCVPKTAKTPGELVPTNANNGEPGMYCWRDPFQQSSSVGGSGTACLGGHVYNYPKTVCSDAASAAGESCNCTTIGGSYTGQFCDGEQDPLHEKNPPGGCVPGSSHYPLCLSPNPELPPIIGGSGGGGTGGGGTPGTDPGTDPGTGGGSGGGTPTTGPGSSEAPGSDSGVGSGSCANGRPDYPYCGGPSGTGDGKGTYSSGDCENFPSCSGDPVACGVALEAYRTHCKLQVVHGQGKYDSLMSNVTPGGSAGQLDSGEKALNKDGAFDFNVLDSFQKNRKEYIQFAGSCPPPQVVVWRGSTFTVDTGPICQFGMFIKILMHIFAYGFLVAMMHKTLV